MTTKIELLQNLVLFLAKRVSSLEKSNNTLTMINNLINNSTDSPTMVPTESPWTPDSGDTAWMLTSTALVLFMTIPGLALYYAGMVREKNVLSTVMQSFSITCLITFLWLAFGYSLCFGPVQPPAESSQFIGDASRFWLQGMTINTVHQLAPTIPESVYCMYQLTFAIITPALICGSFADRMKYGPMMLFMAIWHLGVYCPIAHSTWHPDGFLFKYGALDFAGGLVVHISSGISGLVATVLLGHRKGFGKEVFEPHNILLSFTGASMLWVGWFGFNAGSAVHASENAGYALLVTQISSAVAGLSWMITEWLVRGQPSVLGMVSGSIAGLVGITPASGYVDMTGAFIIGLLAGPVCYFGAQLKKHLGYDDALDAFGVHAIGGMLGAILTGFFSNPDISGNIYAGVFYTNTHNGGRQLGAQIYAIVCAVLYSGVCTFIILKGLDMTIGLRVSEAEEMEGLDSSLHGETIVRYVANNDNNDQKALKSEKKEGVDDDVANNIEMSKMNNSGVVVPTAVLESQSYRKISSQRIIPVNAATMDNA